MTPLRVMTERDYHSEAFAEPGAPPMLSSSCANTLIGRSPFHAHREHPRLGGKRRETTGTMDVGTIVHGLLLDPDPAADAFSVLPFDSFRTKAAQETRDQLEALGRTVILEKQFVECKAAADAIKRQLGAYGFSLTGQSEGVALWFEQADDGTPVACRGRLDHWLEPTVIDIKTTHDAHPRKCVLSILEHGYDLQAAAYVSAMEKLCPDLAGRVRFVNVFVEMADPYLITPLEPSGAMLALGRSKWRRAVNLWARCLREQTWPGYVTALTRSEPPQWALTQEMAISPYASELAEEGF